MATSKIISIIDHEVAAALRLTAGDIAAARDQAKHDVSFVAANLRHDINSLAAAVNTLRQDVERLKQGFENEEEQRRLGDRKYGEL